MGCNAPYSADQAKDDNKWGTGGGDAQWSSAPSPKSQEWSENNKDTSWQASAEKKWETGKEDSGWGDQWGESGGDQWSKSHGDANWPAVSSQAPQPSEQKK